VRRPRLRRRSPRLLFIAFLAATIGAAVWHARIDEGGGAALVGTGDDALAAAALNVMPGMASHDALASTWYCAAGTGDEGGMADHAVTILNPGVRSLDATVTVYGGVLASSSPTTTEPPAPAAAPQGASVPAVREIRLPPHDRVELRLGDVIAAPLVAALIEAKGGAVAVEHRVAGPHGVDVGPCTSTTAPVWHLALGTTTRDAREVVVLFNPFPTDAIVDVSFDTDDGPREPVRFQGFPVAAGSVVGVDIGDDVAREAQVSATLRARTGRVIVERLQEFDGSRGPEGLAVALGVPGASMAWAFADGAVDDGGTERIVIYNPSDGRAEVEVSVLATTDEPAPEPQPFRLSVRAGAFTVVDYGAEERIAAGVGHATLVRSTNGVPVVAERALTQSVDPDDEDDDGAGDERTGDIAAGPGAALAATRWAFPSSVDGDEAAEFVVFNPDRDRSVRVTLVAVGDGRESPAGGARDVALAPQERVTVRGDVVPGGGWSWLVDADGPVVAEWTVVGQDGLRLATGPGVPSVEGAVPLGELVGG
jgi:hypothetical protein